MGDSDSVSAQIPDKRYFRIGEVAKLVGVQAHVLRYWERELPFVNPGKSSSNQRRYRRKDIETFMEVRRLLQDEQLTLSGVKKRLRQKSTPPPAVTPDLSAANQDEPLAAFEASRLEAIKRGLRDMVRLAGEEP